MDRQERKSNRFVDACDDTQTTFAKAAEFLDNPNPAPKDIIDNWLRMRVVGNAATQTAESISRYLNRCGIIFCGNLSIESGAKIGLIKIESGFGKVTIHCRINNHLILQSRIAQKFGPQRMIRNGYDGHETMPYKFMVTITIEEFLEMIKDDIESLNLDIISSPTNQKPLDRTVQNTVDNIRYLARGGANIPEK